MRLLCTAAACGLAAGFSPAVPAVSSRVARCSTPLCALNEQDAGTTRRAVLSGVVGVVVGSTIPPANAGYVTSLGIETTSTADAVANRDSDLMNSGAVQTGITNLKNYRSKAAALQQAFTKQTNADLIPIIRKEFDFAKLRDDLNVVTTVFDEDTQLTIDRASRGILYDLTELENAARIKKGETERTEKKVGNVMKWFAKLDSDLGNFLAYLS